jgi:4'-phosphopantetheinyl transferase
MTRPLGDRTVQLWWMAIDAIETGVADRRLANLDVAEQARADRFHFACDREAYVGAHALKRRMLASFGNLPDPAWRFVVGPYGKPEIDPAQNRERLCFNLSHTRGLAACAVAVDRDLGLDAEALDNVLDGTAVANRYFAAAEVELLRGVDAGLRSDAFVRLWTLKEAYVKATGRGLSSRLDSFSFKLEPVSIFFDPDVADDPASWQFVQQRPTASHLMALAVRREPGTPMNVVERAVRSCEL